MDSVAADDTQFGARIAPGPLVYAISIGLAFQIGRLTDAVIAFLGTAECRRLADCYIDDTVSVQCEVIDARPSTGARSIITIRYTATSHDNRRPMGADMRFLMHKAQPTVTTPGESR